jgi:C1A family cysteine protease
MLKKILPLAVLTNVAAVMVGCGQAPMAPMGAEKAASSLPTIMANGKEYTLGFDDKRYKQVSKKTKVTKLPKQNLLPTKIDNTETCSPVADQSKLGACTAFAVGKGFREYEINRRGERKATLSPLFLYFESRRLWGSTERDSGSTITDSISVLERTGIATEESFPYDITKFMIQPPAAAYETAKEFKYDNAIRISSLDDAQTALSKGQAVMFAYDVMESFRSIGKDGVMPVPASGEKRLGGHAVLAVGYDNQKQLVKVRNSWGASWGDKGYFYMPYAVFKSNARDIWTSDFRTAR